MRYLCPKDVQKRCWYRARSVYWKKWAAKHEQEELKEGGWIDPALVLLRKKANGFGLRGIVMWPERSSWKEVGRKRDYLILAGRISVNV